MMPLALKHIPQEYYAHHDAGPDIYHIHGACYLQCYNYDYVQCLRGVKLLCSPYNIFSSQHFKGKKFCEKFNKIYVL